jgi:ribose transport system substrate-binding protein
MNPPMTPFRRRIAMTAVTVAASALLAACGSSGPSSTGANGTDAAATSSAATSTRPGVSQAAATVAKYENAVAFTPAGKPLSGVKSALAGKTVYYVPITQQVPIFPVIEAGLGQALGAVGARLHVCDGGATPSTTSACLNQAIADHAAAVVTDSIPYGFAQQGFAALGAHGIPILLGDEPSIGPGGPASGNDKLAFLESNQTLVMSISADWIIAHSGGKADVLVIEITDSPLTVQAMQQGALEQFKKCTGCTVHVVTESTANLNNLGSAVSSALLKDRNIGYVFSEFDTDVQPSVGGVVQSGFTSKVTGVSSMGILGSLQMLKAHNYLYADTGSDGTLLGWEYADQVFRMLLGKPVLQTEDTVHRIFTRENASSLQLTQTAQQAGSWYTTNDIQEAFKKLWGLTT